jgi:hypothetical protein
VCAAAATARESEWRRVAVHPEASKAAPAWGARWLWSLQVWRGRLFAGYGSFNGTNPRAVVRAFDPEAGAFSAAPDFATDNEALFFRALGPRLYAPALDANSGAATTQVFAATEDRRGDLWRDHAGPLTYHVFDVATLDGRDLWLVGSAPAGCPGCSAAVAYRSTDGGRTFSESLRVAPPAGYLNAFHMFAGVLGGRLYVQAFFRGATAGGPHVAAPRSRVFDGEAWADGPDLLPARREGDHGHGPQVFAGRLLYLTRSPVARSYPRALPLWQNAVDLVALDRRGRVQYLPIPGGVANFTADGSRLYVLSKSGQVRRTKNPDAPWDAWESLPSFAVPDADTPSAPSGRSIAVLDGRVYVGTSRGELWRLEPKRER